MNQPVQSYDPIHNADAERCLIADMFIEPRIVSEIARAVPVEAYWREVHRKIASAVYAVARDGAHVDPITVADRLQSDGNLEAVGGAKTLVEICGATPSAANWESHAAIVNASYQARRLDALGMELRANVAKRMEVKDVAESARRRLTEIVVGSSRERWEYVDKVTHDVLGRYEQAMNGKPEESTTCVPTGCQWFDHVVGGGIAKGHSYYVGALYKIGKSKTTLAPIIALARKGWYIDWWSTEMSANEMTTRMISHLSGVTEEAIASGAPMGTGQMTKFVGACAETASWKSRVRILQDGRPNVDDIELESVARAAQVGTDKYCIVVDYLQSVKSRAVGSGGKTHEHVEDCSQRINAIAKSLNVPVVIIYQLLPSKVEARRGNLEYIPVPKPDDCKGGSQMLMDANHVIMFHRPYRDAGDARDRFMIVDRAVARAGTRRVVSLDWCGATNQFQPFRGDPPHPFRIPTEEDPRLIQ